MPIVAGVTKTYRGALLTLLASHTLKAAFYNSSAALDKSTVTNYTTTNELTGSGYVAGGYALTPTVDLTGDPPFLDFADLAVSSFTAVNWAAIGIYDVTDGNRFIQIISFTPKDFSSKTVLIVWPTPLATSAVIRVR